MAKIELDKYYTNVELAKYCINKTFEIIGKENITEIIEPSAGNGSFSLQIDNCIAYDIKPEHESIMEQDYLELELEYKKGRLFIGNPPFGSHSGNMAKQFYKKNIKEGDYIAYILPISQFNNNVELFDFDLIYSENLTNLKYSGVDVHCCFNIYKRPLNELNKKPKFELKDINFNIHVRGRKTQENFNNSHIRICAFGSVGKSCKFPNQYCKEFLIDINNENLKEKIIEVIKNANWKKEYVMASPYSLTKWQVVKYLKKMIPEIE